MEQPMIVMVEKQAFRGGFKRALGYALGYFLMRSAIRFLAKPGELTLDKLKWAVQST